MLLRQTIRKNANFLCMYPQDTKNVNKIYNDHMSSEMSQEDFCKLCPQARDQPHCFVTIDLWSWKHNGRYRNGQDVLYMQWESYNPLHKIVENTSPWTSMPRAVCESETKFATKFDLPMQLDYNKSYAMELVNTETHFHISTFNETISSCRQQYRSLF